MKILPSRLSMRFFTSAKVRTVTRRCTLHCPYVVFERGVREFQSHLLQSYISHVYHSNHKNKCTHLFSPRKSTLEYEVDYDENLTLDTTNTTLEHRYKMTRTTTQQRPELRIQMIILSPPRRAITVKTLLRKSSVFKSLKEFARRKLRTI